jgi:hypothetical protein
MHAVLMLAAAHLHALHPSDPTHHESEAHHLSLATQGLRAAIASSPLDPDQAGALCGCSALLYTQAWSSRGEEYDRPSLFVRGERAAAGGRELDFLVRLGMGLKGVFLDWAIFPAIWASEVFGEEVAFRPILRESMRVCCHRGVVGTLMFVGGNF